MGRFERTRYIIIACLDVLLERKSLLVFPLISGASALLVLYSYMHVANIEMLHGGHAPGAGPATQRAMEIKEFIKLFLFYFVNYFIITFFNTALSFCALRQLRGEVTGVMDGLREAGARIHNVIAWALIMACFGVAMRLLEQRAKGLAALLAAALAGIAFSIASYFVIPIMVAEDKGPLDALKEGAGLFKKVWGEEIISGFGFAVVGFALFVPAILLCVLVFSVAGSKAVLFAGLAVLGVYFITCILVLTALEAIFRVALYTYASTGQAPDGFDPMLMRQAFSRKT